MCLNTFMNIVGSFTYLNKSSLKYPCDEIILYCIICIYNMSIPKIFAKEFGDIVHETQLDIAEQISTKYNIPLDEIIDTCFLKKVVLNVGQTKIKDTLYSPKSEEELLSFNSSMITCYTKDDLLKFTKNELIALAIDKNGVTISKYKTKSEIINIVESILDSK